MIDYFRLKVQQHFPSWHYHTYYHIIITGYSTDPRCLDYKTGTEGRICLGFGSLKLNLVAGGCWRHPLSGFASFGFGSSTLCLACFRFFVELEKSIGILRPLRLRWHSPRCLHCGALLQPSYLFLCGELHPCQRQRWNSSAVHRHSQIGRNSSYCCGFWFGSMCWLRSTCCYSARTACFCLCSGYFLRLHLQQSLLWIGCSLGNSLAFGRCPCRHPLQCCSECLGTGNCCSARSSRFSRPALGHDQGHTGPCQRMQHDFGCLIGEHQLLGLCLHWRCWCSPSWSCSCTRCFQKCASCHWSPSSARIDSDLMKEWNYLLCLPLNYSHAFCLTATAECCLLTAFGPGCLHRYQLVHFGVSELSGLGSDCASTCFVERRCP